jgi:hypothetical protein
MARQNWSLRGIGRRLDFAVRRGALGTADKLMGRMNESPPIEIKD